MTEGGFLNYKRGAADVMIVPFNPWILLLHVARHALPGEMPKGTRAAFLGVQCF